MMLENDLTRAEICAQTGAITGLFNKVLDSELIAFPEHSECWRLSIPYREDTGFIVFSKDQQTSPLVSEDDGRVTLRYRGSRESSSNRHFYCAKFCLFLQHGQSGIQISPVSIRWEPSKPRFPIWLLAV